MIKPQPLPEKWRTPLLLLIILLITVIAFLPSLSNQFIQGWDDAVYVTGNPLITHLNWESIKGFFTTQKNGTYVPIPLLTWALEFKFFGLNPFPYHLDNLILHLLCTSLVFHFLLLLRLPPVYSALGALLFGIHPMHVESVAWVTERKDLLFCTFYLGALIAYIQFIISKNRKQRYFFLALMLFVFSLFSKIQAVSLPLSLFLIDYWLNRPLKWNLLREKIPFLVLSLGFGLAGYFILEHSRVIDIHDPFSLSERILFGLYSLCVYIIRLIAPLNLSAYYPYPVLPGKTLPVLYYLGPVFLLGIAFLVFLTIRKTKAIVFGTLFFLVNVMFLLQFVRAGHAFQADRFTYVSYTGLFFIIAWAAHKFANRNRSTRIVLIGLLLIIAPFFFSTTYARCKVWKDSMTFWNDLIRKYPQRIPIAYYNLGIEYGNLGQWDKAIDNYSMAIRIDPKFTQSYTNRGVAYGNLRQWNRAIEDYCRAIGIEPDNATAWSNRGVAFGNLGQWDKAINDYSIAIGIDPANVTAWFNRGIAFKNLGQWDKAITDYSRVIGIDPNSVTAYSNRGFAYGTLGQWDKAIADYTTAISIDPNRMVDYSNRGVAYGTLRQWDKAIADYSKAIGIDPNYVIAYVNRGNAYCNLGQWEKAIADYSRAIEIDPNYTDAYANRDFAYRKLRSEKR